jgi:hypothetical protein
LAFGYLAVFGLCPYSVKAINNPSRPEISVRGWELICLYLVDYHPLAKRVVPNPHQIGFFVTFGAKIKANQLNINWLALLFRIFFRNLKC